MRAGRSTERGSTSLFFVVIALGMFLMIGLVVDGGGKIRALQKADAVAEEAARTGGQAINASAAVRGQAPTLDTYAAQAAARDYLSAAGVQGTVTIIDSTHLSVTTTTHYTPVFLGLMGTGEMTTTGHASVALVRGIGAGGPP